MSYNGRLIVPVNIRIEKKSLDETTQMKLIIKKNKQTYFSQSNFIGYGRASKTWAGTLNNGYI